MIVEKPPKPIPLSLWERFRLACDRAKPRNVWKACLMHHKLFFLPMDTQAYVFSAPERVAVFHASLWFHALLLAVLLRTETNFRPGEDPACAQLGLMSWDCLGYEPAITVAFISTFVNLGATNLFMVGCRGRSLLARTRTFTEEDREKAFIHHAMGLYPMCWHEPEHVVFAVRSWWSRLTRRQYGRSKYIPKHPLHWQPSVIFLFWLFFAPGAAYTFLYTMFFYSSSAIMEEITYSNRAGYLEVVPPPLERAEVTASAEAGLLLDGDFVIVPHLQRYMVLLLLSWCLHLFLLEPLVFMIHLFIGEPTIEVSLHAAKVFFTAPFRAAVRFMRWLLRCGCCRSCCGRKRGASFAILSPRSQLAPASATQEKDEEDDDDEEETDDEDETEEQERAGFLPGQPTEPAGSDDAH